jgi:hypothetical protein
MRDVLPEKFCGGKDRASPRAQYFLPKSVKFQFLKSIRKE